VTPPRVQIGEGFAGDGVDAAHVNTVLGPRDGPIGGAWANALASPSAGHAPFVVVAEPNLPVQPMTLFVNKATITTDRHGTLTWGAAQAGVAAGVLAALRKDVIVHADAAALVLIAAVWVNPEANDASAVCANNEAATLAALAAGRDARPTVADLLPVTRPHNPYFGT
jgi:5,6,7,8-tetrahydromethanopterin hydro-lyase